MAAAFPFVAPAQGPGVLQPFPNPSLYLGAFSSSNPSASVNGQWWYRVDTNQIMMYVSGRAVPVASLGPTIVVYGSQTIGGANVVVTADVVVLPSSTLVTYGSVLFARNLYVLPGAAWVSSNPNASATSSQTNSYSLVGSLYLDGQYVVSSYNVDELWLTSATCVYCRSSTVSVYGYLYAPSLTMFYPPFLLELYPSSTLSISWYGIHAGYGWLVPASGSGTVTLSGTMGIGSAASYSGVLVLAPNSSIYVPPGSAVVLSFYGMSLGTSNTIVVDGWLHLVLFSSTSVCGILYGSSTSDTWSPSSTCTATFTASNGTFSLTLSPASLISGTGVAMLSQNWLASVPSGVNTYAVSGVEIAPGASYTATSYTASGNCCTNLTLTSVSSASAGWAVVELYGSNSYYYLLGHVYVGSAGALSSPYPQYTTVYDTLAISAGTILYLRGGQYGSNTIYVSGTLYV